MPQPKVSIVVINAYGTTLLRKTLEAIRRNTDYLNFEIIVVDCCSRKEKLNEVMCTFNDLPLTVKHIENDIGPALQHNVGALRVSKDSKYIVFLDNDVEVLPRWLTVLVKVMERDNRIGVVQPSIMINGNVSFGCDLSFGGFPKRIMAKKSRPNKLIDIFYAEGAAFITRTDLFFRVGLYDGDYFIWYDDIDYCWRVRLAGYRVTCASQSQVIHYQGSTTGKQSPKLWYYLVRNDILSTFKNRELPYALIAFIFITLEAFLSHFVHSIIRLRDYNRALFVLRGFLNGLKDLRRALSKRMQVNKIRVVKESELMKSMNFEIDRDLLALFL